MGDLGYVIDARAGDRYKLQQLSVAAISPAERRAQRNGLDIAARERLIKPVAAVQ